MELKPLLETLRAKPINHGAVVLSVDEYQAVLKALTPKRGRPPKEESVPREAVRS